MPLSSDPEKRAKQLANLRSDAAVKHGAQSEARIRETRERYLAELAKDFPNASAAEVAIQAQRLAQLEALGAFLDERGVIRHKRRGEVFPAAALMERIAAAFEKQHAVMREREESQPAASGADLASIVAELTEGEAS